MDPYVLFQFCGKEVSKACLMEDNAVIIASSLHLKKGRLSRDSWRPEAAHDLERTTLLYLWNGVLQTELLERFRITFTFHVKWNEARDFSFA